ncbi:MAG: RdgB/HAM1 family non-canonical purine NTP pyrophosphatase [Deltaproteobacteria bacterium]|nr:RdgB/HAM1 family non-canonical purine NTP pyrophosphatase [Deltaproteobacteria bacterium]
MPENSKSRPIPRGRLTLAVASSNPGKLAEFRELLGPLGCEILCLGQGPLSGLDPAKIPSPVEDGAGFSENAGLKARYWADLLGLPCLADDSGLLVTALDGAPGIMSARWGGIDPSSGGGRDQSRYLLKMMEGKADRRAEFAASLVLAKPFRREILGYRGSLAGEIARELRGENGFGYDFVFFFPALGKTLAEISRQEKGQISHRGRAVKALREDWPRASGFLSGQGNLG